MIKRPDAAKRLFVLDTNVLMHDPTALFRFDEHDIFLPMVVLEELDRGKKGLSEVSRNVRQVSRFLDDLLEQVGDDFGPVLLEELQSRLEYIVQNFNDEVISTFKGSFKKWNFTHEQLNELMSSDVKLKKPEEKKVQKIANETSP